jgi:uncharacterized membrane protein
MNRTTTVVVALIAAAGLSTMVYAVPEQRALAWGGGFGGCGGCGGFGGCGDGCGGGFFGGCGGCGGGFFGDPFGFPIHKHIIQTISQTNDCTGNGDHQDDQKAYGSNQQDQNQKDKQIVCLNTAVNNAGRSVGADGVGNNGLGNNELAQ